MLCVQVGKKGGKKGKKAAGEESSEEDSSEDEDLEKMDKYARIKAENIKKMAALSKGKAAGPGQTVSLTAIQSTYRCGDVSLVCGGCCSAAEEAQVEEGPCRQEEERRQGQEEGGRRAQVERQRRRRGRGLRALFQRDGGRGGV